MRIGKLARLTVAVLALVSVAACGGGGGGDPVAVVKDFAGLVEQKQFDKLPDLSCAADKDKIKQQFDFGSQLAGSLQGIDAKAFTDSMTIKFENLDIKQVDASGDKATVSMTGTLKMSFDQAKLADIVKAQLKAAGMPVDDASVSAMLTSLTGSFAQGQTISDTVNVVKENGKWVLCGVTQG